MNLQKAKTSYINERREYFIIKKGEAPKKFNYGELILGCNRHTCVVNHPNIHSFF
jgi:hypothetical protein